MLRIRGLCSSYEYIINDIFNLYAMFVLVALTKLQNPTCMFEGSNGPELDIYYNMFPMDINLYLVGV